MSFKAQEGMPKQFIRVSPRKNPDGSFGVKVEIEPEFEQWFIKSQGLEEWNEDAFTLWFKKFFDDAIKDNVEQGSPRSEQQNIDIWNNGEEDE